MTTESPDASGPRVAVGLSGGVDSAVAALLLLERGFEVVGVMMTIRDGSGQGCAAGEDAEAARELARRLGIPFKIVDCSEAYRRLVLDDFRREYLAGRTPNPCVRCNPLVKFGTLPALLRETGLRFDRLATGHYARVEYLPDLGRRLLLRGIDEGKDQSYFLYRLSAEQLAATIFPLGGMRKSEVRALAEKRGLPAHDKPDSQDFYAGDYVDLLGIDERAGDIVMTDGRIVGRHAGYWNFTPGQRKGLGVAHTEPLYVLRVEPAANRVVVGPKNEELRPGCVIGDLHFHLPPPAPGARLRGRLRSAQRLQAMVVGEATGDGGLFIDFPEPIQGVAPGQSLVLYDGDIVVGGGVIRERR